MGGGGDRGDQGVDEEVEGVVEVEGRPKPLPFSMLTKPSGRSG
jgi:hypothetical protein